MTFQALADKYLAIITDGIKTVICEDQYVGSLCTTTKNTSVDGKEFQFRKSVNLRPNNTPAVIIILESPHVDEFKKQPIGPARGTTGRNIRNYINEFIPGGNLYSLIIMNAINYQCSLGLPTCAFRDDVFRETWNIFGNSNFETRLKGTFRKGDFLINACTKGKTTVKNKELRRMVESSIKNALKMDSHLRLEHPAYWHIEENRSKRW